MFKVNNGNARIKFLIRYSHSFITTLNEPLLAAIIT